MVLKFGSNLFEKTDDEGKRKKELYLSIPACAFSAGVPTTRTITHFPTYTISNYAGTLNLIAPVNLPHGAVVTNCIVHSNISDVAWTLLRTDLAGGAQINLATANLNTAAIVNQLYADVDNLIHGYVVFTNPLSNTDKIYGATITYTI